MKISKWTVFATAAALLALPAVSPFGYRLWQRRVNRLRPAPVTAEPAPALVVGSSPPMPPPIVRAEVAEAKTVEIARDLRIVWSLRSAPDGRLFIAERPGRILLLAPGATEPTVYAQLRTALGGESGLMGLALHPAFPREPFVYVMYTARKPGGGVNRISRFVDAPGGARDELVLIDDIPAARNHDGGALEFGPDGMLYIGTGDASVPMLAQDRSRLNGKILRIAPDGKIPDDNPVPASPVWAYGFRNVSGLAFHPETGALWAASHGPSSIVSGEPRDMDAVYIVEKGRNHGWPLHRGVSHDGSFVSPVIFFPDRAAPPGGLIFFRHASEGSGVDLLMTSLRGQELHRFVIEDGQRVARHEQWWTNRFGRIRGLTAARDGSLYLGTSNRDGRADREYAASDFVYRVTVGKLPRSSGAIGNQARRDRATGRPVPSARR